MTDIDTADSRLKCRFCGHTWTPRTSKVPLACPSCKRYKWQDTQWEVESSVRPTKKGTQ